MKFRVLTIVAVAAMLGLLLYPHSPKAATEQTEGTVASSPARTGDAVAFACQGRVEGNGDPFDVSAAIDGVIETVTVKEGQSVIKGQLLARIACGERLAAIEAAEASVERSRNALLRLKRGSRDEERRAAAQTTAAAKAVWENSRALAQRYQTLYASDDISRQMFDNAQRDLAVAEASLHRAEEQEKLILAPPLPEDLARLESEVALAKAQLAGAQELIEKCEVRSPVSGSVVKVLRKKSESVSTFTPQPIVAVADLSVSRVRAEVDERDVSKVSIGQVALVRVDESRLLRGHVVEIGARMGRKSIQSVATSDKNDRDVLDVWIAVPPSQRQPPLGLRVLVQFLAPR